MCIFIINMPRKITIHLQTTGTRIYHADGVLILPQIARIFTDFLLPGQQLLADEWMCSPQE